MGVHTVHTHTYIQYIQYIVQYIQYIQYMQYMQYMQYIHANLYVCEHAHSQAHINVCTRSDSLHVTNCTYVTVYGKRGHFAVIK